MAGYGYYVAVSYYKDGREVHYVDRVRLCDAVENMLVGNQARVREEYSKRCSARCEREGWERFTLWDGWVD